MASFPSSYIPTTTASATRAADVLTCTAGVSYPLSLWAEFERVVDTGTQDGLLRMDTSSSVTQKANLFIDTIDRLGYELASDGANAVVGAIAAGVVTKGAARYLANDLRGARGGSLGLQDTTATEPTAPTRLVLGDSSHNASGQLFGYIRRAAIFNSALSNANLQTVTT